MKKIIIAILSVTFALTLTLGINNVNVHAAENEYVKSVKTLIGENGGSAQPGGSGWNPVGNYSAYNQEVEQIEDPTQEDGGDMIFRSATNADNTALVSSAWGYSKHSETRSKACYDINGLVIKYYDNTATQKFIIFNENFGQLNSGRFFAIRFNMQNAAQGTNNGNVQLGVWYQSNPTGSYTWDSNLTWLNWSNYNYGNDYDYFSDPAAKYYKEGNSFKGTQNTLEFKLNDNNELCLYLNKQELANLTTLGVVSNVISQCTEGMYISFWGEGGVGANAFKLTDIYNEVKEWSYGVPSGYTTTDASSVESKISSTGAAQFRNAKSGVSYNATYETAQYLGDLKLNFTVSGEDMAENDTVTVSLGSAEFAFKKVTSTTAFLSAKVGETVIGEQTVPFYYTDVANVITLSRLKNFTVKINGEVYDKDLTALETYESGLEDGKVKVGFKVESFANTVLTPVEYVSNEVVEYDTVDGLTVEGENVVIKSDGSYLAVYNTADGAFTVTTVKKAIANSLAVNYKFGATNAAVTGFTITADKMSFKFAKNGDKTVLSVLVNGEKVLDEEISYDWTYTEKTFRFVNDNGYGYMITDGESELMYIDKDQDKQTYEKIDAAVSATADGMTEVAFTSENGQGMFAFAGIDYYVATSVKAGWKAGGYGTPKFGYDDGKSSTLVFNGNSFVKDREIVVDGFEMKVKTFFDETSDSYSSPAVVISSASSWFTLDQMGTIMFSIEKTDALNRATFRARGSLGEDRYIYMQDFTIENWNWNNNKENEIKLNLTAENVWVWTINGTDYPATGTENRFSDKYNQAYEDFATNAGTLQFDSGSGYIWKITSLKEVVYNVAPVAGKVELKDSYKAGEEVTIDLNKAFTDANGDELTFTLVSGSAEIKDGKLVFKAEREGVYEVEVKADDQKGGVATLKLKFTVKAENTSDGESCAQCSGGIFSSTSILTMLTLSLISVAFIASKKKNKA